MLSSPAVRTKHTAAAARCGKGRVCKVAARAQHAQHEDRVRTRTVVPHATIRGSHLSCGTATVRALIVRSRRLGDPPDSSDCYTGSAEVMVGYRRGRMLYLNSSATASSLLLV